MHSVWFVPILSTVLTLAILGYLWFMHRFVIVCFRMTLDKMEATERSLRSHVVDEADALAKTVSDHALQAWEEAGQTEGRIIDYIKAHFEDLRKHAEDLRNHAKELSDRAEVQASPPREAVLRPRI